MTHVRLRSLVLLAALASPSIAHATTYPCPSGNTACLIQAVRSANINGGQQNTIVLAGGTYTLQAADVVNDQGTYGLPSVLGDLLITSSGPQATIQRLATAPPFGIVHVAPGASLTLRGLLLAGAGSGTGWNAAIYNNGGTVTVQSSTLQQHGESALVNAAGATATVTDSVIQANQDTAIFNYGTLTLSRTAVLGNRPKGCGGLSQLGGMAFILDSRFADHNVALEGGAICVYAGSMAITRSTFARNVSGGPGAIQVDQFGSLAISKSAFSQNQSNSGGALNVRGAGVVTVRDSTFANNFARNVTGLSGGVAINTLSGTVDVVNATFSGNTMDPQGGAGAVVKGSGITMTNTIISHAAGEAVPGCSLFQSKGHNILAATDACDAQLQQTDIVGDAGLETFYFDLGIPGQGHFDLQESSRAINAGDNASCDTTDQLGHFRDRFCDIGAIEYKFLFDGATTQPVRMTEHGLR